jgi:DNA-binding NarL/FixJ family response regulator
MITGTTRGDAARQAIAAGAEDFLIKPVQAELLVDSLKRTVHRTRVWRMQVDRIEARTDSPRPQLSVVVENEATYSSSPPVPTDSVLSNGAASSSRLVAWPPLPTLKALDIDRCADALAQIGGLTDRERNILVPLLRGEHNADIAQLTGASERTVKFHVSNIFKKLRVTQRCELLRFFF